jgi:hypothetical protein
MGLLHGEELLSASSRSRKRLTGAGRRSHWRLRNVGIWPRMLCEPSNRGADTTAEVLPSSQASSVRATPHPSTSVLTITLSSAQRKLRADPA